MACVTRRVPRRLRERVRGPGGEPVYTVVEKILERDERLPDDWAAKAPPATSS
jgi:maltooligosyltrehalose synthase